MKKVLKHLLIAVAVFIVFFAGIIVSAHIYLLTDPGRHFLLKFVNTLYPGKITGKAIELSLLRQEASLKDVVLLGPDKRQVFRAERAFLKMDLPALLKQELIFERIAIVKPDFVLKVDRDNWLNIEAAFVAKTGGVSPFNVYIKKLTCEDGTFAYKDTDGKPVVWLNNFDLVMDGAFEQDTTIHLLVPSASMFMSVYGRHIDLGKGSASGTVFNDRINDIRISTKNGSSTAQLTGSITEMSKKSQLHWRLDLDTDMADLRDAFHLGTGPTGRIIGSITAQRDYNNPELTSSLDYSGGTLFGITIGKTALNCTVIDKVLSLRGFTSSFASGLVKLTGTIDLRQAFPEGYFDGIKDDNISYGLLVETEGIRVSDLPGMPKGWKGLIRSRATIAGTGISPETMHLDGSFKSTIENASAGPLLSREDLSIDAKMRFSDGELRFDPLFGRTRTLSAACRGLIDLTSHSINGTLTLKAPRINDLLARWDIKGGAGLSATVRVSGIWDKPNMDIIANLETAHIKDITLGNIDIKALLDESGMLNISSCTITNKSSRVETRGTIQVFKRFPDIEPDPAVNLEAQLKQVNPADIIAQTPVAGFLGGNIIVKGHWSNLSSDMSINGEDLSSGQIHLGEARFEGSFSRGVLTISRLAVTNKASVVLVTGDLALMDTRQAGFLHDPAIHIEASGDTVLLEDLTDRARGMFSLVATIDGTLRHPTGSATIAARDIDLGFQRFKELTVSARADGQRIWIEPARLTVSEGQEIDARGWVTPGGAYAFSLGSKGLSLSSINYIEQKESARGDILLDCSGEGALSNPQFAGTIKVTGVNVEGKPLDDLELEISLKDHKVLMNGNWNCSLNASDDLKTGDFTLAVIFAETELSPYFTMMGRPAMSGKLTGRIDAQGHSSTLNDINLTADISSLDILHDAKALMQARNASASYKNGILLVPQTRITFGDNGWFDLKGQGDIKKAFSLDANGVIPAPALGIFFEDLSKSSGVIRVSSQFHKESSRIAASALFTLEDIAYIIPENGQQLHDVNGKIRLEGNRVTIDNLDGRLDTGYFKIYGTMFLDGYTPREIALYSQTNELPISIEGMMDLTVDSQTTLSSSGDQSSLKSDVIILDGTYYKDVKVNLITGVIERILPKQRRESGQFLPTPWPFMKNMALDVTITRKGDVKVENNVAQLTFNPDMKIIGTLANPILTGRIAVIDGTVTFQNNDFTVNRGVIDFLNPYRTEATFDIKSETKVREWDITLAIVGDSDNLQFKLSSIPAEEPPDILSLLVIGKTSHELTQNQTGVTVAPKAMAAELLTSTYGGKIKKASSLDILELRSSELTTAKGGENLKLTLGKEFSRNITLKYEMETRSTGTIQTGIAEYKLLDNLLISGSQASDGVFGTDIQFRYEFR